MTRGGDVKSFFQQRKVHAGAATKPTGGVSKKAAQHQTAPAFHVHSVPDHGDARKRQEEERVAREFDMNMRYGPCLGLTRAQRWLRADALGLAPPPALLALCAEDQPCIWEGRV